MYLPAYRKICMAGLFLLLVFFCGRFSKDDDSKELESLRKKERVMFQQQIIKKQVELQQKDKLILAEQDLRADTIAYFVKELAKSNLTISQMKKRNENRSFDTYSDSQLDSLLSRYYVLPAH